MHSVEEILAADFDEIRLAEVRLSKGDPPQYVKGRIVERFDNDLVLRWRGHENEVPMAHEWELERFTPVRSSIERKLIEEEMA